MLETNLDDVSSEVLGDCVERALAAGALDVFHTAIQMKKSRPGHLLGVLTDYIPALQAIARALVEQPVAPMVQQVSVIIQTRVPPDKREALQKDLQGELKKYMDAALPLVRDKVAQTTAERAAARV